MTYALHSLGSHTATVQGSDALGNPGPTDSCTFTAGIFIDTCGSSGTDDCAARLVVPGGAFVRDNAVGTPAAHQTMRDFDLDKYEVTNARWNIFVTVGSPVPPAGGGHHVNASGQADLSSGWDPSWNGKPLADSQGRAGVGPGNQPVAWVTWYGAFAFCAFSGGYLPYEGEWDYAAAGGGENRIYPWGSTPVPDRTLADFNCQSEIPASLNCGPPRSSRSAPSRPAPASATSTSPAASTSSSSIAQTRPWTPSPGTARASCCRSTTRTIASSRAGTRRFTTATPTEMARRRSRSRAQRVSAQWVTPSAPLRLPAVERRTAVTRWRPS